jgi:hypothetical protein
MSPKLMKRKFKINAFQIGVILALLFICVVIVLKKTKTKEDKFEDITGLNISDSVSFITKKDTYFVFEGEYSLVLKTTKKQIKKWINERPPWDNKSWNKGPIPFDIGIGVQFNFKDGVARVTNEDGKEFYSGDTDLETLLNDSTSYYVFKEDCCPDLRFHDGQLLILQPNTQMVYYSGWNY